MGFAPAARACRGMGLAGGSGDDEGLRARLGARAVETQAAQLAGYTREEVMSLLRLKPD